MAVGSGTYKVVRLLTHIHKECGVDSGAMHNAVVGWLMEDVEEQAARIVHHVFEGYKRTDSRRRTREE